MPVNRILPYLDRAEPQPVPLMTTISRIEVGGECVSAISRSFEYDSVPRCKLCPEGACCAVAGQCLVQVNAFVSDRDAPLYRVEG
jgi:hypothetical protein